MLTGVLESFDRDEMKHIVERFGGRVTGSVSKKTSYVVVGRDAGATKVDKVGHLCVVILYRETSLTCGLSSHSKRSCLLSYYCKLFCTQSKPDIMNTYT